MERCGGILVHAVEVSLVHSALGLRHRRELAVLWQNLRGVEVVGLAWLVSMSDRMLLLLGGRRRVCASVPNVHESVDEDFDLSTEFCLEGRENQKKREGKRNRGELWIFGLAVCGDVPDDFVAEPEHRHDEHDLSDRFGEDF